MQTGVVVFLGLAVFCLTVLSMPTKQQQALKTKRFLKSSETPDEGSGTTSTEEPNISEHSFRLHLFMDMTFNTDLIRFLRLSFLQHTDVGSYIRGSLIDASTGVITAPTKGYYYFHAAVQVEFLSSCSNSDSISVGFYVNLKSKTVPSNPVIYHNAQAVKGKMTIETSGVIKLEENDKIKVYVKFPDNKKVTLKSSTIVEGFFLKSSDS